MRFTRQVCAVAAMLSCLSTASARAAKPELEILVLFDNTSAREDLQRSWGFSALVDFRGHRVLFDAGSDPILLLEHLEKMRIDPKSIEHAVISHQHGDHLRGVYWVFEKNPKMTVHFLDSFPEEAFRRASAVGMKPRHVKGPFEVPAHCSGDVAKELFRIAYGDQFNTAGAGRRILLDKKRLVIETLPLSVKYDNE